MSERLHAGIAGLVGAGEGSRLRKGLIKLGEVEQVGDNQYRFTATGQPFEKPLTEIAPPDPAVEGDQGVTILDLAVKDALLIPDVQIIRFLTNEQSNIPGRYREAIDRVKFLQRLGLPALQGDGVSPTVRCEYFEQPPRSKEEYPYYGTAWAFHLVSQGIRLRRKGLMMITETDSVFLSPSGESVPAGMVEALRTNRRGATAGLSIAPMDLDPHVSQNNGLGLAFMEPDDSEAYFRYVLESGGHGNISTALASGLLSGRNTTRVAADAQMLTINNQVTIKTPPKAVSNHEYQATDTYNARATEGPVYAYRNPDGVTWVNLGELPGLLVARETFRGLRDAQNPQWSTETAA